MRPNPAGVDIVLRRRRDQERWHCGACLGSTLAPAPGEPPLGWLEIVAGVPAASGGAERQPVVRACTVECLARLLPQVAGHLEGQPWQRPEPGPTGRVSALMREVPGRR